MQDLLKEEQTKQKFESKQREFRKTNSLNLEKQIKNNSQEIHTEKGKNN